MNKIGHEGAEAIADALKLNSALMDLRYDLFWPSFDFSTSDNNGVVVLDDSLFYISRTFCSLWSCEFGVEGGKAIAEALKVNTTLTIL